jgi:hypothetical protein
LAAAPEVRTALLKMSAATIDRALQPQRERCGMLRRQPGSVSTIRRSIPVRTFSDWDDPPPGFVEADLVAHSGPVTRYIRADAGCHGYCVRLDGACTAAGTEQTLLVDILSEIPRRLPFPLLGFDVDNDTIFMNETVRDYCAAERIELTACRGPHAWGCASSIPTSRSLRKSGVADPPRISTFWGMSSRTLRL